MKRRKGRRKNRKMKGRRSRSSLHRGIDEVQWMLPEQSDDTYVIAWAGGVGRGGGGGEGIGGEGARNLVEYFVDFGSGTARGGVATGWVIVWGY